MSILEQRAAIVAQARKWIGTPYVSCASVLGAGVDCGRLLVRVFVDSGLVPPFDAGEYSPEWNQHNSEERYLAFVTDRAGPVDKPEPGDVILWKYAHCFAHGGIVTCANPLTIIHAYQPDGLVIEEQVQHNARLSDPARERRAYSIWAPKK